MRDRLAAGVDLGGTKIHTVVANAEGSVLGEDRRPTDAADGPDAVVARIAASVRAAAGQAGAPVDALLGVAGSAASGSGAVARDHDEVLAEDRW